MGNVLVCDMCRKTAPAVTFGNDGAGNDSARSTPISFNAADGTPRNMALVVELKKTKPAADLCDSCIEEAITGGLRNLLTHREQAKRGMFVIGHAAAAQLAVKN